MDNNFALLVCCVSTLHHSFFKLCTLNLIIFFSAFVKKVQSHVSGRWGRSLVFHWSFVLLSRRTQLVSTFFSQRVWHILFSRVALALARLNDRDWKFPFPAIPAVKFDLTAFYEVRDTAPFSLSSGNNLRKGWEPWKLIHRHALSFADSIWDWFTTCAKAIRNVTSYTDSYTTQVKNP